MKRIIQRECLCGCVYIYSYEDTEIFEERLVNFKQFCHSHSVLLLSQMEVHKVIKDEDAFQSDVGRQIEKVSNQVVLMYDSKRVLRVYTEFSNLKTEQIAALKTSLETKYPERVKVNA